MGCGLPLVEAGMVAREGVAEMTLDDIKIMRTWIDNISVIPPNHEGSAAAIVAQQVVKKEWNDLIDLAEAMLLLEKLFYDLSGRITFDYRAEDATFERADDEEVTVFLSPPIVQPSDLDKPWKTLPEAIREGAKLVEEMPP